MVNCMKNLRRMLIAACTALLVHVAHSQITIQSAALDGELISTATLFRLTVHNASTTTLVKAQGAVHTPSGEAVLMFASAPFNLPNGVSSLSAAQLTMQVFDYAPTDAGRSAKLFQRLPPGRYQWCIRITSTQVEGVDEWCDATEVEDLFFLDLVYPWNGDTIDEVRPPLTWTASGSPLALSAMAVRITLAPMPPGMNAAQAIAANTPVFHVPQVKERTLIYPPGARDLVPGQCYAWQAERVVDGRVADRTEPWSFCLRERIEPMADKYIRLDRLVPGTVYTAVDRRLFFRYDDPYGGTALRCMVIGPDRRRIAPEVQDDATNDESATASVGANLYELDLSSYSLKPGIYTLEVLDAKGRRYELQFESKP